MYIVVIFCLNTRQNHHKFNFLASVYIEVWEISIFAATGQYIWEISKNAILIAKSIGKYFGQLSKFHLFPSLGMATHVIWLQIGKFLLFPPFFGSVAVKTVAFLEISSFLS